jgi:hypothetical protein
VTGFDDEHGTLGHDAENGEEWRSREGGCVEVGDGALEVVGRVIGFGGQCPGRFVAGADVDAAEEDRMESEKPVRTSCQ